MANPIEQFEIHTHVPLEVAGINASITNSSLWMIGIVATLSLFFFLAVRRAQTVPGRMQSAAEMFYEFVAGMVRDNAGEEGRQFFPFIFTLFAFLLGANLAGLLPYSFTVTSHIIVTFSLAATVFVGVTIIGFIKHGWKFLRLFAPSGVPLALLFMIVPMEIISYFMRPVSLSVRLFANMLAGHLMLKVFAGFVVSLGALGSILGIGAAVLPFAFDFALTGLEFLVAVLQAYVFAILSCIYLNDALHPAH
ncbi:MAG: F0F1 ATP synthase subunit A [Alphaproteobacteria bacterium]|nr:MAG: F0F1 ATP synthase subunit A [Alphaproteobacteria bacterium]